jgi:hypothetical protein
MAVLMKKLSFDILHEFVTLNTYMEKHSKEVVSVDGLRDILTENIALLRKTHDQKALAIADTLQQAVNYSGEKEANYTRELTRDNTQRFRLLKDYIQSEKMETLKLKTELDTILRTGTIQKGSLPSFLTPGAENIKIQSLSTEEKDNSAVKEAMLATNARIIPSLMSIKNGEKDQEVGEIKDMGASLVKEVTTGLSSFARDIKKNDAMHTLSYA